MITHVLRRIANLKMLLMCIALLFLTVITAQAATPPALTVNGNSLYANGSPIVLHGVNIPSLETTNGGEGPPNGAGGNILTTVQYAINTWHVNLIRLPICQDRWEGKAPTDYDGNPDIAANYQALVDSVVNMASNAGVYVLIDMHWSDMGVWGQNLAQHQMPDDNTTTAWTDIATHYANNPAVLFDAYNEPYPPSWSLWLNGGTVTENGTQYHSPGMQGIVNTIRATGANNVISVSGISSAGDISGVANGYAITGSNIMYSAHVYPFGAVTWDQAVTVVANTAPILIGEFGASTTDDYGDFFARVIPWITQHNYNYTAWGMHPQYPPALVSDWNDDRTLYDGAYAFSAMTGGPSSPAGLLANGHSGSITLTWNQVSDATSYNIYRSTTPQGEATSTALATGVNGTSYTDSSVTNGTEYFYQVQAVNGSSVSGLSNESGAVTGFAGNYRMIYDHQLEGGYYNYSYGPTINLANGSPTYGESQSVALTYTGSGQGLQFRASEFDSSPYNTLTFWINGGSSGGQTINVYGDLDGSKATAVAIGPLPANTWVQENISFSALGIANNTTLDGFRLENPGGAEATVYFDGMYISGSVPTPNTPTGFASTAGNGVVTLNWNPNNDHDPAYNIYRGTSPGGENSTPIAKAIGGLTYTDSNVTNGTTYYYKIAAVDPGGTSAMSNEISATPLSSMPPPAPGNLTASASDGLVALNWNSSSGATSYNVYRGTLPGGESPQPIATNVVVTSYNDSTVSDNNPYYYQVVALNTSGTSLSSNEALGVPQAPQYTFESGIQGWTYSAPITSLTTSSTEHFGGSQSLALNFNGAAGTATASVAAPSTPAGVTVTFHIWIPSGSQITWVQPFVNDANFNFTGNYQPIGNLTTNAWNTLTVNVPAGAALPLSSLGVQLNTGGTWAGTCYIDSVGWSASSYPSTPTEVTATPGDGQVVVSWTAVSGATSYSVYGATAPGNEGATPIASSISGTSYTNTGLTNGNTYYYKVSAVNSSGASAQSLEARATPSGGEEAPAAPTGLTATAGNTQVALSWTASSGATSYNVYRGTSSGGEGTTPIASGVAVTSYTDTGVSNSTTYFYYVKAVNSNGTSSASNQASATPSGGSDSAPSTPTNLVVNAGYNQCWMTWSASSGATSYTVYRSDHGSTPIATVPGTFYADNTAQNGQNYYYSIVAVNSYGSSSQTNSVSGSPTSSKPTEPSSVTATGGSGQVALSWTASSGATSYSVYRGTGAGVESTTPIATGLSSASYTDTAVTGGTTYYYRILAVSSSGSTMSDEVSATPSTGGGDDSAPSTPTNLVVNAGYNQCWPTWSASSGATSYTVYRSDRGSTPIATVPGTFYVDNTAQNGQNYNYLIAAVNSYGSSSQTNSISGSPTTSKPTEPSNVTAAGGSGRVALSWTASSGATSYSVYRGTATGVESTTPIATGISSASYTDTTVTGGTTYYYRILAVSSSGSTMSDEVSATPSTSGAPSAPTGLTATAGDTQVALSWTASSGATSYSVYRGTSSGGESGTPIITGVTATSYIDTGVSNSTTYFYYVKAVNSNGTSSASNETSATPGGGSAPSTPTNLAVNAGYNQCWPTWSASGGAVSYEVYRSDRGSSPIATVPGTFYVDNTTQNGQNYYYSIVAVNSYGSSSQTNTVSGSPTTSKPTEPSNVTAAGGSGEVALSWTASSGATSYSVYRGTGAGVESTTPIATGLSSASYTDTAVTGGTTYYYRILAVSSSGSTMSDEVSAKP